MRYYVYALQDQNGYVFYVGKGCGNRTAAHFEEYQAHLNPHKWEQIQKCLDNGAKQEEMVRYIATGLSEEKAFQLEADIINEIGLENLTNQVLGGKGGSKPLPEEEREQRIKALVRWNNSSVSLEDAADDLGVDYSKLRVATRKNSYNLRTEAEQFDIDALEDRLERLYGAYCEWQNTDVPAFRIAEDYDGVSTAWLKEIRDNDCLGFHTRFMENDFLSDKDKRAELVFRAYKDWQERDFTSDEAAARYGIKGGTLRAAKSLNRYNIVNRLNAQ